MYKGKFKEIFFGSIITFGVIEFCKHTFWGNTSVWEDLFCAVLIYVFAQAVFALIYYCAYFNNVSFEKFLKIIHNEKED